MSQKTVKIDADLHERLTAIGKDRGIPIAEQLRRAGWRWVKHIGPIEEDFEWAAEQIQEIEEESA